MYSQDGDQDGGEDPWPEHNGDMELDRIGCSRRRGVSID